MTEAIVLDKVGKEFTLRHARSIKEMTVRAVRRQSLSERFQALDGISLSIEQGDAVALMGLNGSGKSTLLKLISGVLQPDRGSVRVRGRVAGLIEVGAGLHPDLTGRENIYLNAAILGMSRKETDRKFDTIVEFSEIGKFLDTQVKFYSSGMFMRLGFAVAAHTEPDVFLVDEALSVGDVPFQKKCLARVGELHAEGRTLVIVSHDMDTLRKVCDRGIVLRAGQVVHDGRIEDAVHEVTGRAKPVASIRRPDATEPVTYLVGSTGRSSYGDELIAAGWLRTLAEQAPDREVWLDCPDPGNAAAGLGHLNPRARFTDTFWRLCESAPSDEPRAVADFARRAFTDRGAVPRLDAGLDLAARADIVHLIGGGYLNGLWPRNYGLLGAAAGAAAASGKLVMTGQGLWPPPEDPSVLSELTAEFDLIDVRDRASAELLGDGTPVSHTGDDAFLDLGPHYYRDDDLPSAMVCMQSDLLTMTPDELARWLLATLEMWEVDPADLGFVEGISGGDRDIYERVSHRLPGARFFTAGELLSRGFPGMAGQVWLSSRFHMHLMAAAAGAAGIAVSVNPDYYANKHTSLIEQGSGWLLTDPHEPVPRPAAGGFDPSVLAAAKEAKSELLAKIYA